MKISIIGTGYVGLVTGVCFAEVGYQVLCLDIDKNKIKMLHEGKSPIYEPGLEELLKKNIKEKRISFTSNYENIKNTDIIFFALPTPSNKNGSCNISYLKNAAEEICKYVDGYRLFVIKSTVPMTTTHTIKDLIKKNSSYDFDIVSNPEFLKEGTAVSDCMKPDRIVIGYETEKALNIMEKLYAPFMINHEKLISMDILSAEMTKYASNAMLATRISFMNELSQICKRFNANINHVRFGMSKDKRIGEHFLYAGAGYGGSCFPKDINALCFSAKSVGYTPSLLNAVKAINERQKKELGKMIQKYFQKKGGVKGKTIAIWGLSFKPNTDDMREAPSLTLIKELVKHGALLKLYDPVAMEKAKKILKNKKNIIFCNNEFDSIKNADGIALLTEWSQFRKINFSNIKNAMKNNILFDGRNQYNPKDMKKNGFEYFAIGVPKIVKD